MLSAVDWMTTEKRACVHEWSSSRLVGNSSITRIREELPVTLEQSSKSQRKTGGRATVLHFLFSSASQFTTNAIGSGGDGSNRLFIQEVLFVGRDIAAREKLCEVFGNYFVFDDDRAASAVLGVSSIFAACEIGTAKFEPEKPESIAKFTPITLPLLLNTGPPDPPEVVCAS